MPIVLITSPPHGMGRELAQNLADKTGWPQYSREQLVEEAHVQGIKLRRWNPGLVVASIQFIVSIYAAYFLTMHGLSHTAVWWASSIILSILVHVVLFNIMKKTHC